MTTQFTEKDRLDSSLPSRPAPPKHFGGGVGGGGQLGDNDYGSDRYLAPSAMLPGVGFNAKGDRRKSFWSMKDSRRSEGGGSGGGSRGCLPTNPKKRKWVLIGVPVALVVIIGAVVGAVVAVLESHKSTTSNGGSGSSGASGGTSGASSTTGSGATSGTNTTEFGVAGAGGTGTTVTTDLGVTFTYVNNFGGSWAQSPGNPYSVSIGVVWNCLV